jgi:hypothetical protein
LSDLTRANRIQAKEAWTQARALLVELHPSAEHHFERALRRTPTFFREEGWVFVPRWVSDQVFVSFDGTEVLKVFYIDYYDQVNPSPLDTDRPRRPSKEDLDVAAARTELYGRHREGLTPQPSAFQLAEETLQRTNADDGLFPTNWNYGKVV